MGQDTRHLALGKKKKLYKIDKETSPLDISKYLHLGQTDENHMLLDLCSSSYSQIIISLPSFGDVSLSVLYSFFSLLIGVWYLNPFIQRSYLIFMIFFLATLGLIFFVIKTENNKTIYTSFFPKNSLLFFLQELIIEIVSY